ncbi:MAG: ABC transporter permease [Peptococcaceae bacterium]|nr:ABC transporter permease [Peptococcaceae bacterium]
MLYLLGYIARRFSQMLILLVGISIVSFAIMHIAPGNPVDLMTDRLATAEEKARIATLYGFDQPIPVQYIRWASQVIQGNFGRSFVTGEKVLDMIAARLPATLFLNFLTLIIIYALSIPIGIISAIKQYSWFDHVVTFYAFLGQSMPQFWLALLLLFYVGLRFPFIQTAGMSSYGVTVATEGLWAVLVDRSRYLILPLTVVTFSNLASITRYMRASMLDVINQDYVRTAKAKGLAPKIVILKHAFRNALLPLVTMMGFELPILFSGSVIIETIFAWPGVGLLSWNAVMQRDYQVIMAFNLLGASMMVLGSFLADMLYLVVDPRIKYN